MTALGLALLYSTFAATALALPGDLATKYPVNDADPVSSVPSAAQKNADPIEFAHFLQDLIARAQDAIKKKDWEKSVKYHEAMAVAVPDKALPFSRLCTSYAELGKVDLAVANCALAIRKDGARVFDHMRYVNLLLQKKKLSANDVAEAEASLAELRAHAAKNPQPLPGQPQGNAPAGAESKTTPSGPAADPPGSKPSEPGKLDPEATKEKFLERRMALMLNRQSRDKEEDNPRQTIHLPTEIEILTCKLAARISDAKRLNECMQALRGFKLNETLLLPFEWSLALIEHDDQRAEALFAEAKRLGFSKDALASMERDQKAALAPKGVLGWLERYWLLLLVACGALFGAVLVSLRHRGAKTAPKAPEQLAGH